MNIFEFYLFLGKRPFSILSFMNSEAYHSNILKLSSFLVGAQNDDLL